MGDQRVMTAEQCKTVADATIKQASLLGNLGMGLLGAVLISAADALRHHETRAGGSEPKAPEPPALTPWDLFAAGALARGGLTIAAAAEFADDMVKERGKRALKGAL